MRDFKLIKFTKEFLRTESASGVVLAFCAVIAMLWANSAGAETYFAILHFKIFNFSIQHWINDALMVVFFFVVGMEIKRELVAGELSSRQKAALPIAAALGGMIVPAFIYFFFNPEGEALRGWGIPMATDIAFALGVLSLFGRRVPLSLKIFLLALAIVDDLGAVLVIAFFYTSEIRWLALAAAAVVFVLVYAAQKNRISNYWVYLILGILAWAGVLLSGVHATVAGVLLGLMTPLNFPNGSEDSVKRSWSPLNELVHALHPWVSFFIMPIFGLANAGIALAGVDLSNLISHPVHQGVALGLLVGKPIGILLLCWLSTRLKLSALSSDLRWSQLFGVACLGGVGFTMSLFISSLALSPELEIFSKTGILFGSMCAAVIGAIILHLTLKQGTVHSA